MRNIVCIGCIYVQGESEHPALFLFTTQGVCGIPQLDWMKQDIFVFFPLWYSFF